MFIIYLWQKQADVNSLLLLLGLLCHMLPLMFRYAAGPGVSVAINTLQLSRASSIFMLVAYVAYIFFQLKTHRQLFDSQEVINDLYVTHTHTIDPKYKKVIYIFQEILIGHILFACVLRASLFHSLEKLLWSVPLNYTRREISSDPQN